jgi:hypothetical protein
MYTAGVDYFITQKTREAVIQRLEGGIIPPRGMVFVYIDEKDMGAALKDQSDIANIVAEVNGESLTYEELLKQYNLFFRDVRLPRTVQAADNTRGIPRPVYL